MSEKMRFIRKNGRVIPVGGKKKKKEVKHSGEYHKKQAFKMFDKSDVAHGKAYKEKRQNTMFGMLGGIGLGALASIKASRKTGLRSMALGGIAGMFTGGQFGKVNQKEKTKSDMYQKKSDEHYSKYMDDKYKFFKRKDSSV